MARVVGSRLVEGVERNIECIVNHIHEDGPFLRLRVGSVAEAIPRRMTGGVGATMARERSTYMIVLARWDAIIRRRLELRLRVGRVP